MPEDGKVNPPEMWASSSTPGVSIMLARELANRLGRQLEVSYGSSYDGIVEKVMTIGGGGGFTKL